MIDRDISSFYYKKYNSEKRLLASMSKQDVSNRYKWLYVPNKELIIFFTVEIGSSASR